MQEAHTGDNFEEHLTRFSITQLEEMAARYPYFHQVYPLLAKKYQEQQRTDFAEKLHTAALYAQDRAEFFSFFHPQKQKTIAPRTELIADEDQKEKEVTPLLEEQPEAHTVTPEIEQEAENAMPIPSDLQEAPQEEPITEGSEKTFDEWIKLLAPATKDKAMPTIAAPAEQNAEEQPDEELNTLIQSQINSDYLREIVSSETHYSRGLDDFIQEQINKRKAGEQTLATAAGNFDTEPATETLAQLYESQKRYAKAIKTYEALALKFPEKNDFFAARINYLKSL